MRGELVRDDLVVASPAWQDITYAYKLRAWKYEDGSFLQEYGGFPTWTSYVGYDVLDMTKGCVALTGRELEQLKDGLTTLEGDQEWQMLRLFGKLTTIYDARRAA